MDEAAFKELAGRLKVASKVIEELDPVLREDAWAMLRPFIAADGEPVDEKHVERKPSKRVGSSTGKSSGVSEDVLIEEHESDKESDNLYLVLAVLYQRHGRGPFSIAVIKSVGRELDLTLPARPDTTFRNSSKKVVRKQDGGYKLQPSGEKWLKETYNVQKGKQPLPG
ncbi:MAG TPA: hypothetical protein VG816_12280 [Solirubrobacterales bacterium]|nr:hypothetical protein [Solirubrobacterales bacterium]